jgi:hypothetical protein
MDSLAVEVVLGIPVKRSPNVPRKVPPYNFWLAEVLYGIAAAAKKFRNKAHILA